MTKTTAAPPAVIATPAPVMAFTTFALRRSGEWFDVMKVTREADGKVTEQLISEKVPRHIGAREASMRVFDWLSGGGL